MVFLYWLYSLLALGLGGWMLWGAEGAIIHHGILAVVLASMAYDCFAIAISPQLGPGLLLQQLNRIRFWLHHGATPLLLIFIVTLHSPLELSATVNHSSAFRTAWINSGSVLQSSVLQSTVAYGIALSLVIMGFVFELRKSELTPIHCAGTLRYRSAGFCPLPSIVVTGAIAWWGINHLENAPGVWVLGTAIAVFAINGIRQDDWKLLLSPAAELGLIGSLATLLG